MLDHVFYADLSKELGDVAECVHVVRKYITTRFNGSASIEWFAKREQCTGILATEPSIHHLNGGDSAASQIRSRILTVSANGNGSRAATTYHVFSYDRLVFEIASGLNDASRVVVCHHLAEVRKNAAGPKVLHSPSVSSGAGGVSRLALTIQEAVDLAKRALRGGGYTSQSNSLPLTQLRPAMMYLDGRAKKDPFDPASKELMRSILSDGRHLGWLGYASLAPGQERVWLNEAESHRGSELDERLAEPAHTVPASPPQHAASTVISEEPAAAKDEARELRRWQIFRKVLWDSGIGPEAIPRGYLFDAIDDLLKQHSPQGLGVGLLSVRACPIAQQKAADDGIGKNWKWGSIARCVERVMIGAEVFLDASEQPIRRGVGSVSKIAVKLRPDFRNRCEAWMLEQILRSGLEIKTRELTSLGLAFLRRGLDNAPIELDEIRSRVDFLLDILKQDGRIDEDGEYLKVI